MIAANNIIKFGSIVPSDFETTSAGYVDTNYVAISYVAGVETYTRSNANTVTNGGQGGWTFASLTEDEVLNIQNSSSASLALPSGTFPFLNKILIPVRTGSGEEFNFLFDQRCICQTGSYFSFTGKLAPSSNFSPTLNYVKASYTNFAGKLQVATTSVPATKQHITHLIYTKGWAGNIATGQMTITPQHIAMFEVGLPGSGKDIIMHDTSISVGKDFLIGVNDNTTFELKFTSKLTNIQPEIEPVV
jgi:hypothetical protein